MSTLLKVWMILLILCALSPNAQTQDAPFSKGVNLSGWFQADNALAIQFARYSKKDFENIKSLGADVIRLPINLHLMTNGSPDYELDPLFLTILDQVVYWAEETEMYLILDNHSFAEGDNTDPAVLNILKKIWPQMAAHFEDRSELILYEIMNEPHGISNEIWGDIQKEIIADIREVDDKHTIIVGGSQWNSYNALEELPVYEDDNLIYTFHFYDPFLFTHQGATWVGPSLINLANLPFPYDADAMPGLPAELIGTWVGNGYDAYDVDGTVAKVKELIDIAVDFKATRNVPIYCGEFGVYQPNSAEPDRVSWYELVRTYLEEKGIAWTMWDYKGGFGIFNEGSEELFDHDFNVPLGEALGFNVPDQTPFEITPDMEGQILYDDFLGAGIVESGYQYGTLNFYSTDAPNYGNYCINWTEAFQYNQIGFDFQPNRDFSFLVDNDYFMDFFVRSDQPWEQTQFDMRFVDTKTSDPEDHPWRMRILINAELGAGDGIWKRIRVPLKDFSEHGSWDNDQWYEPLGAFDWSAIDRLEMVTEYGDLGDANVWLDHIAITNVDTAVVVDDSPFVSEIKEWGALSGLSISPNPTADYLQFSNELTNILDVEIFTIQGTKIDQFQMNKSARRDFSGLSPGIYFLRFKDKGKHLGTLKMVKR